MFLIKIRIIILKINFTLKAIKNPVEIQHLKKTMAKDGAALVRIFRWLEQALDERPVPETEVAERLTGFRSQLDNYFGDSFDAIVGYNGKSWMIVSGKDLVRFDGTNFQSYGQTRDYFVQTIGNGNGDNSSPAVQGDIELR